MSNYTKTTNFLRKDSLPDTDTDKIIRGSEFDTEFNNLVTAVASKANIVSPEFTGVPRAPTAAAGTSTTQLATTAFVAQNAILTGMIVMWSGAVSTIPTGYALCDGSNSTPDLRDGFVMCAGTTHAVNATGGSANSVVVSHNHSASTNTVGNHTHGSVTKNSLKGPGDGVKWLKAQYYGESVMNSGSTGGGGSHAHSVTVNSKGESGAGKNIPPYYALAFIMKT